MSIFKKDEVFLFSPVNGYLTYEKEPASNTSVKRLVECDGKSYEDVTITDSYGHFSFEPLKKFEKNFLPKEFVSHQKIIVNHNGKDYLIWETVKRSEELNSELEGQKLDFKCEITDEYKFTHMTFNSIGTNCKWEPQENQ
ncbi:hypothetical protein MO867_01100 [Microbulbifer sp. OS29]|uniref:DUF6795 domain-containing protein n=1 Tax=Microbulbifer okhotskensis TaxID=2926617 RepID=A0A9X2J440_9GAMM|nr:DUF6795 domain-containing protein [Microbulbifer okhotskensis]MCO1332924.1 hypothetical protein [Microbulbifer okhotskensis]